MVKTYWDNKGTYQKHADALYRLLPASGKVMNPKRKKLEKFRKASNAYYQLFNNGNLTGFYSTFGIAGKNIILSRFQNETLLQRLEDRMDEIILAAAEEAGLVK